MSRILGCLAVLLLGLGIHSASALTLEVGPDKTYKNPSDANNVAKAGDHILISPGEYFDCAIVHANDLVIEGVGKPESVVLTDKTCGGKALLVTSGNNITIRNLTLARARVPDGNGAGIRAEGLGLTVDHVRFVNNQNGILSSPQPNGAISISNSEFLQNGTCERACAHGIYINALKLLHIEHTHFLGTKSGHNIKSRAARTEVIACTIEDGPTGTSSYQIEIPNGGSLVARDNVMEKGPKAENHGTAIAIGTEGVNQRTEELLIENNKLTVDGEYTTVFVRILFAGVGHVKPLEGD
jgi:hypothetical protein